jgi:hypothetical protein
VRYEIFGLTLESDTPLRELPPSRRQTAELAVFLKARPAVGRGWTWAHEWTREDGSVWLRFGRRAGRGDRLLRLPRLADFLVTDDASAIRCRAAPGVPLRTVRHLLIDHVVPIVLSARGHLLLHASGISTPAGSVLFAGSSGTGKSTLAFLLSGGRSRRSLWRPLADDVVRIEMTDHAALAVPAYPGARLWPDVVEAALAGARLPRIAHYSDKRRLGSTSLGAGARRPQRVSRVLVIGDMPVAEEIALRGLTPQAAFAALVPHVYRLDIEDATIARAQFDALSRFCEAVAARALAFPRRFERIDDIRRAIARDLGA